MYLIIMTKKNNSTFFLKKFSSILLTYIHRILVCDESIRRHDIWLVIFVVLCNIHYTHTYTQIHFKTMFININHYRVLMPIVVGLYLSSACIHLSYTSIVYPEKKERQRIYKEVCILWIF